MKSRTLILRLWRDAAGALHVQLNDPLREMQARFAAPQELWLALERWINFSAPPLPPNEYLSMENQDELEP